MNVVLFSLFCAVFANDDATSERDYEICQAQPPAPTVQTSGRKAWEKCKEYQETLDPCKGSACRSGALAERSDRCMLRAPEFTSENDVPVPHMVLLGVVLGNSSTVLWRCGAALLSEKFILGPANCKYEAMYAKIGSEHFDATSQDKVFKIKSVIVHPEYKDEFPFYASFHVNNDIALFELEEPVQLNMYIVPACLPVQKDLDDDKAIRSYWVFDNDMLEKKVLTKFSYENCSAEHTPTKYLKYPINRTMQVCYGDGVTKRDCLPNTGGPLQIGNNETCMYTLIGISSRLGYRCPTNTAMYTRVASFVPWIESVVWP